GLQKRAVQPMREGQIEVRNVAERRGARLQGLAERGDGSLQFLCADGCGGKGDGTTRGNRPDERPVSSDQSGDQGLARAKPRPGLVYGDGPRVDELSVRGKFLFNLRGQGRKGAPEDIDPASQVCDRLGIQVIAGPAEEVGEQSIERLELF